MRNRMRQRRIRTDKCKKCGAPRANHIDNALCEECYLEYRKEEHKRKGLPSRNKVTEFDVIKIRAMHELGFSINDIMKLFPLTRGHIHKIVTRQKWRSV